MSPVAILLFLGVTLAAALAPGPSVLLITSLGVRLGFAPALRAALGVLLANLLFAAVSAAGLLALLKSSQALFECIKLAGAAYLAFIGVQMLRSAARRTTAAPSALPVAGLANPLWQGFLNQLSNPKGLLYWGALLPQFAPLGGQDVPLRLAGFGVLASLIDFSVLAGYACAADRARAALARLGTQRLIDAIAGGFFLIAGFSLGTSTVGGHRA